jgi:hypothetical protein
MEYSCPRCGFESTNKFVILQHLCRKTLCKPLISDMSKENLEGLAESLRYKRKEKSIPCTECNESFGTRQALFYHKKRSHGHVSHTSTDQRVEQLERELAELKALVVQSTSATTVNTNQTTTVNGIQTQNNIQQQNNIIINAFGKEDVAYMLDNPKFIWGCLKKQHVGICDYITSKHFNDEHPENQNIRKLNKKSNTIEFHDGEQWRMNIKDHALNIIMRDLENDIRSFISNTFSTEKPIGKEANKILDKYMESVGTSFEWDLNCDHYEFEDVLHELPEAEKNEAIKQRHDFRKQIFELAIEHIYKESKKLYTSAS